MRRSQRPHLLGPALAVSVALAYAAFATAQHRRPLDPPEASQPEGAQHRLRLILKDGSYQVVLGYTVVGDRVRYKSAERNGEEEEIPLALVDLPATKAWSEAQDPVVGTAAKGEQQTPVLSPELAQEEAQRAARSPEVAKDLRLPEEDSVLVLDTFQGTPELVPLPQYGGDLNKETAHAISKKEINPASSPHDLFLLKDERADVQLHVAEPVFFVRLAGRETEDQGGGGFVVDTHGQSGRVTPDGGSPRSSYVIERVDVRQGARAVSSFRTNESRENREQTDVVQARVEPMPGGVWEKITPVRPLEFGEYALIELVGDRTVNADVWDFGVHPTAKQNDEALKPEPRRPVQLERRGH